MDRNFFVAIALCALYLFAYQAYFGPKQAPPLKSSQVISAKEPVQNIPSSSAIAAQNQIQTTDTVNKTEEYDLKTPDAEFSYINVGGSLHKIDFLGNNPFPITDVLTVNGFENAPYAGEKLSNEAISLIYRDKDWQITKIYEIKDKNLTKVRMEIKNLSKISILANFKFTAFEIDESQLNIQNNRENGLYEYSIYSNNKIYRKDSAFKFADKENKSEDASINWVGFRDHYQAFILKPEFETKGYEIKRDNDKQLKISISPVNKNLASGESITYDFSIYSGPQNRWLMKKYGSGFEKIVVFSKFGIYKWPAEAIYYIIAFLHQILKSWGLAIILMGVLFYSATYPLTMKTMTSMRKMQEVQPKLKAIQERYKSDPQKMQAETMEIYRREKINPFGGCLPMLIQMPFFYALYQIMYRAQYFQGQGFLWIKDLTQPDHLITFSFYLPLLGNELNILPILSGGLMFLQQKISSKNMVVTDEQQIMQQKMMMYFMPLLMTYMFYRFTSGWGLYFVTYYLLTTFTQWKIAQSRK